MKKTTPHWIAIAILSLTLTALIGFLFIGSTQSMDDGRTAIYLSSGDRDRVLTEMRALLVATQEVVKGLAEDDLKTVEKAALNVGSQAISTADMKLAPKLPKGFKANVDPDA